MGSPLIIAYTPRRFKLMVYFLPTLHFGGNSQDINKMIEGGGWEKILQEAG